MRRNVVANFLGRAWTALLSMALIPVYVKLLGIEAYGLIGCYVSLTAVIAFLDLGLTTTLNRELARLSATPGSERECCDLVRTLEIVYWVISVLLGISVIVAAPWVARHWVRPQQLDPAAVVHAFLVMGLILTFQWPDSLYAGGLLGLQRQVLLNGIRAVFAALQAAGAVFVLLYVSRTLTAYFVWQLVVCAAQTLVLAWYLWRSLPHAGRAPRFRVQLWKDRARLTAGMTAISITATILTQSDKIVLSRLLSLKMFGYYALATALASALTYIVVPIYSAVFPRFSQLAARDEERDLARLYHGSCQLLSMFLIPAWVMGALFAQVILAAYIKDADTARTVAPLFSLILTGTAFNCLMALPLGLQLAFGWTRLAFVYNVAAVALYLPALAWMVPRYGASGAALLWILVNVTYVLIMIPIMHRRLLRHEMWRWYLGDVAAPIAICALVGCIGRALMPSGTPLLPAAMMVVAYAMAAVMLCGLAMAYPRSWLNRAVARGMSASRETA